MSEGALLCPACGDPIHPLDEKTAKQQGEICHIDCAEKERNGRYYCELCDLQLTFFIGIVCMKDKKRLHTYCFPHWQMFYTDTEQVCSCDRTSGCSHL